MRRCLIVLHLQRYPGRCESELRRETSSYQGSEDQGSTEQGNTSGVGSVATSEGIGDDLGAGKRNAGATSGVIRRMRLRGRSLVLVGESCNSPDSQVLFILIILVICEGTRRVGAQTRRVGSRIWSRVRDWTRRVQIWTRRVDAVQQKP